MPGTRKLGKTTDQRMAMLRQQVTDFLDNGKMDKTVTRAKEIKHRSHRRPSRRRCRDRDDRVGLRIG